MVRLSVVNGNKKYDSANNVLFARILVQHVKSMCTIFQRQYQVEETDLFSRNGLGARFGRGASLYRYHYSGSEVTDKRKRSQTGAKTDAQIHTYAYIYRYIGKQTDCKQTYILAGGWPADIQTDTNK